MLSLMPTPSRRATDPHPRGTCRTLETTLDLEYVKLRIVGRSPERGYGRGDEDGGMVFSDGVRVYAVGPDAQVDITLTLSEKVLEELTTELLIQHGAL